MKEYLKLTQQKHWDLYRIIFFKDSYRNIVHRETDKPAVILAGNERSYYKNGEFIKRERIFKI